jgi:alpha-N-arabinofuranosidase
MKIIAKAFFLGLMLLAVAEGRADSCGSRVHGVSAAGTEVHVSNTAIREVTPQFFGFNLELVEFQNSLWDSGSRRVDPQAIVYLQRFPGAVYRYPGGTVSNHFDWKAAIGPVERRPAQKIVDWQGARVVEFGPSEYLEFVRQVKGTAWYVLNLYGAESGEYAMESVSHSASQLASYMNSQRAAGLPGVYRWELGNELDRGKKRWPAAKYVAVSKAITGAVRAQYSDAEFVGMSQDWEHIGTSVAGSNFNSYVAKGLPPEVDEFAGHYYYDGAPWGPPLPRLVSQICKNIKALEAAGTLQGMWVTEHARAPRGVPSDPGWKHNWSQTADIGAATSVADMMIMLARTPKIKGAFVHSLHGSSGPWPMFHKSGEGTVWPSTVYWALALLRDVMLEEVLDTRIYASIRSGSLLGYYTNVAVFSSRDRSQFSTWMINRSSEPVPIRFAMPHFASKRLAIKMVRLGGGNASGSNYVSPYAVTPVTTEIMSDVDANGEFEVTIPGNSVVTGKIEILKPG